MLRPVFTTTYTVIAYSNPPYVQTDNVLDRASERSARCLCPV